MADEEKVATSDVNKTARRSIIYRYYPSSNATRQLFSLLLILAVLAGITALVLYLVYRPSKPRFTVASAAIYNIANTSSLPQGTVISTSMQFTFVSRNPNSRATILYDHLSVYVAYRNQPITPPVHLAPFVQEKDSSVAISPVLGGDDVPVSTEVAAGLVVDRGYGMVGLRLVVMGRIKYKTGPFRSGWTGLYVRCDALLGIRKGIVGQVPFLGEPDCKVDA